MRGFWRITQVGHAAGLDLEHALGVAGAQHVEGLLVVERDRLVAKLRIATLADHRLGVGHHGEGAEAEEVELDQAHLLDAATCCTGTSRRPTSGRGRAAPARSAAGCRSPRRRRASRRGASGPRGSSAVSISCCTCPSESMRERSSGDCAMESDSVMPSTSGTSFATRSTSAKDMPSTRPDVADRGPRLERPEGHDLGDRHLVEAALDVLAVVRRSAGSVLVRHVADHLVAAPHAEVDVDVRHRHALGVQEALEDDVRSASGSTPVMPMP